MSDRDTRSAIEMFIEDIESRIAYHAKENNLSNAAALGCLDIIKDSMIRDLKASEDDE